MSTQTEIPPKEPVIVMSRVYDAPRDVIWRVTTAPEHVRQWWGGPGVSNPICEMDVRPGGLWTHLMRFPDGRELPMNFVFVEVDPPSRLVWQDADRGRRPDGRDTPVLTVTLDELGDQTRWTLVARFESLAGRDAAMAMGFSHPIAASNDRLVDYLKKTFPSHR